MGGMPRYDETFRAGGGRYDAGFRGGLRGYDAGYGSHTPWETPYGAGARPAANQHLDSGETDFLGRPYPRAAEEDIPRGLIDQERMQSAGYGRGYSSSGGGYVNRDPRGGWDARGYDRGMTQGDRGGMTQRFRAGNGGGYNGGGGYNSAGYGGTRGYDRVAGMRYGGSYGGGWGYDRDMRPEDFHARNLPDSDIGGVDAHRYARGRDLHHNGSWTRWF
jgi:hypothetical protein